MKAQLLTALGGLGQLTVIDAVNLLIKQINVIHFKTN